MWPYSKSNGININIFKTNKEKKDMRSSKLTVLASRNPRLTHGGDSAPPTLRCRDF